LPKVVTLPTGHFLDRSLPPYCGGHGSEIETDDSLRRDYPDLDGGGHLQITLKQHLSLAYKLAYNSGSA